MNLCILTGGGERRGDKVNMTGPTFGADVRERSLQTDISR
jgi:hypothetical protein